MGTDRSSLRGRVAVITGASRGIGLAIAQALAAEGCRLALTARSENSLHAAVKTLKQGSAVLARSCDIRDAESVTEFFAEVKKTCGHIDLLINNAGIAHPTRPVEKITPAMWHDVMATNLTGTFLCTRAALPLRKKGGAIVNNLSVSAWHAFPNFAAYTASKFGALGFTNTLRDELRPRGIRVIALAPGATDTEIWNQFWKDAPRKRMMSAETVAAALVNALKLPQNATVEELKIGPTAGAL